MKKSLESTIKGSTDPVHGRFDFSWKALYLYAVNWIPLIFNLLLQAMAVITLVILFHLYQDYNLAFLRDFFVFVSGWCFFGFVIFFLQDVILPIVLEKGIPGTVIKIKYMMELLLMPVTITMTYTLVRALLKMVNERPAPWFQRIYWIIGVFFFVGTAMAMENFLRTGIWENLLAVYYWGFLSWIQMIIFVTCYYAHQRARKLRESRMRRLALGCIRLLGIFFILYFVLLFGRGYLGWVVNLLGSWVSEILFYMTKVNGLWFYLAIFFPVLFLRQRLQNDLADCRIVRALTTDIGKRAKQMGLSPRETEIVTRVMAGQSNREIEATLFISESTVKNHIYSIYRKLGVKNRVEMFRRFTEH